MYKHINKINKYSYKIKYRKRIYSEGTIQVILVFCFIIKLIIYFICIKNILCLFYILIYLYKIGYLFYNLVSLILENIMNYKYRKYRKS